MTIEYRWQGSLAALVDFTNGEASRWYLDRLERFRAQYDLVSFKFDGGEAGWIPDYRKFHEQTVNPDYYGKAYIDAVCAEKNAAMVSSLEFRIGLHTQNQPIFVRMLDKDSVVGYDNGLKTLIPTALTFGLLGYPFVLPDMIGGNAYRNVSEGDFTSGLLGNFHIDIIITGRFPDKNGIQRNVINKIFFILMEVSPKN